MLEVVGNLWDYPADVRVITTNGTVKNDGTCVMGRGCAKEAKDKFSFLPKVLGQLLKDCGNHCFFLPIPDQKYGSIISFPVKHNWYEKADLNLIQRSARELLFLVDQEEWNTIVMPRPGCGNGNLKWEDVKPIIELILDDRFKVITFGTER